MEECMKARYLGSLAVLLVLLAFPASASTVSFLLIETGINDEAPNTQYTSLWEGGLMAAFFDAGHIVTNSPITRMEKKPSQDLSGYVAEDFAEAAEGGAEYFILGYLEYKLDGLKPVPVGIAVKVYMTDSKKLIHELGFPAGTGRNLGEEYQLAQNAGRSIISHMTERLGKV